MNPTTKAEEPNRASRCIKLAGLSLLLAFAAWFLFRSIYPAKPQANMKPFASLGDFAADETASLIGKAGRMVVVYDTVDPKTGGRLAGEPLDAQGAQAVNFKRRMSSLGTYQFANDWKLPRPAMSLYSVWPAGEFKRLVQTHSSDVIVLFNNPPALKPDEKEMLKSRTGKLVIVGSQLPDVRGLAQERLAHLVIASRVPVPQTTQSETPAEWVKRVYARVTPDNPNAQ